jgi:hypothetical protein
MRLRLALLVFIATLIALPAASVARGTGQARFLASLAGTVTKRWSYTTTQVVNGCTVTTRGTGTRAISLRSADDSVIGATRASPGRARFSGRVRFLIETLRQSGTKTTQATGSSTCDKSVHRQVCRRLTRSLKNRAAQPVSRRRHEVTFLPMTGLVPRAFFIPACPGEPREVRSIAGGLELASASFNETDLFDRNVGGITVQGSSDVTTETLTVPATVVQHVGWRLSLRRLGG